VTGKLAEALAQLSRMAELEAQHAAAMKRIGELERRLYGRKSEKMPSPAKELRKTEPPEEAEARRLKALETRREHAALKEKLRKETVLHKVPDEAKACPKCGGTADRGIGDGKHSTIIDYVPGHFVQREHIQQTLACRCGQYIATAPPPPRALDKSLYGASFVAYVVTMKCGDSLPLYRLAKQFQRIGVPIVRSTLHDLFHGAAAKLEGLWKRLLELIRQAGIVQADETPILMQRPNKRGYIWVFLADNLIAYRFSGSRSGETAAGVLGGTSGTLVVDAYTGYNAVTQPEGRERAGCNAHMRRGFFDALGSAPVEARHALDLILELYRVEHEAKARNLVRTQAHLELRQTRSRAVMDTLHAWLVEEQPKHLPKGPLGEAIKYALNQWTALTRFLDDVNIPVDNNRSEAALRVIALGRKNFLFVGDEDTGENLAGLYSLVATCEANGKDPIAYLEDVLLRVDTHPASRIDELLPHRWTPPAAPS
jgi:transposase